MNTKETSIFNNTKCYYQLQFLEKGAWADQEGAKRAFFPDLKEAVGWLTPRERIIKRTITEEVVESGESK